MVVGMLFLGYILCVFVCASVCVSPKKSLCLYVYMPMCEHERASCPGSASASGCQARGQVSARIPETEAERFGEWRRDFMSVHVSWLQGLCCVLCLTESAAMVLAVAAHRTSLWMGRTN